MFNGFFSDFAKKENKFAVAGNFECKKQTILIPYSRLLSLIRSGQPCISMFMLDKSDIYNLEKNNAFENKEYM